MDELQEWLFRHGKHIPTNKLEEMLECKSNYMPLEDFKFFISGVDVNGDHEIDYDEFLILVTKKLILATLSNFKQC